MIAVNDSIIDLCSRPFVRTIHTPYVICTFTNSTCVFLNDEKTGHWKIATMINSIDQLYERGVTLRKKKYIYIYNIIYMYILYCIYIFIYVYVYILIIIVKKFRVSFKCNDHHRSSIINYIKNLWDNGTSRVLQLRKKKHWKFLSRRNLDRWSFTWEKNVEESLKNRSTRKSAPRSYRQSQKETQDSRLR